MLEKQSEQVKSFFDKHAPNYAKKYKSHDEFYNYFFFERLENALLNLELEEKKILDIGCGTGGLYDYLISEELNFESYYGCDISSGMIESSNIPYDNRFVGNVWDTELSDHQFNLIFMLGVTTYMEKDILTRNLQFIKEKLTTDGVAIITFTNKLSIDNLTRNLLKIPVKVIGGKERIANQKFKKFFYTTDEVQEIIQPDFNVQNIKWLNHTFFPASRIFPSFSIRLAKWISGFNINKEWISSDFMIFISK
ncbi:MAG: class I SAM-dependent methyltransferase [Deltaproteobacteria bacterium]|nr:class I SAM-dependent methyltransferase [Deltaproteobacteria bacterium]